MRISIQSPSVFAATAQSGSQAHAAGSLWLSSGDTNGGLTIHDELALSGSGRPTSSNQSKAKSAAGAATSSSATAKLQQLLGQLRSASAARSSVSHAAAPNSVPTNPEPITETYSPGGVANAIVSGVNSRQVTAANVQALAPDGALTVSGAVTQAARKATLTVVGGAGGVAPEGGRYELSSSQGTLALDIAAGESLADVAGRINQAAAQVGVSAAVVGDDLALTSNDAGSSASLTFRQIAGAGPRVAGANDQQVAGFTVDHIDSGAADVVSGTVVSTAQHARLAYVGGSGGVVTGTATFRLTGAAGSAVLSITQGESLANVAQRINQVASQTGATASVAGDQIEIASAGVGSAATVRIETLSREEHITTAGANAQQVTSVAIDSLASGSEHTLAGHIVRSASSASLTLVGNSGAVVQDTATFNLTGKQGTRAISITAGESISAVASRVNAVSSATGVAAQVSGNDLVFQSTDVGSDASLAVQLTDIAYHTSVSGVNSQQFTSFAVNNVTNGSSQQLTGSVTQTAGKAQLTFTGALGLAGTIANLTLTGNQGSAQISVFLTDSLSAVATKVNQKTAQTGVQAVVQGNTLTLQSTGVGSAATVAVAVNSGSFNVQGGDGHGTAHGADAVAVVNGQTVTGAGNQFSFTNSLGSYSFTAASGFTGAFSPISIASQAGQFSLTGGHGDGTSNGLDGVAEINGATITGADNHYVYSEAGGQFELDFASGFTGTFDPVTIRSQLAEFSVSGGDGSGFATGADAVAVINGQQLTSANNEFSVATQHGSYDLAFAAGFQGAFDPITIDAGDRPLQLAGADESGAAYGANATAVINGREYVGDHSRFFVQGGGVGLSLDFAADFQGAFDPIQVTGRTFTYTIPAPAEPAPQDGADAASDDGARQEAELAAATADALNQLLDESQSSGDAGESADETAAADGPAAQDAAAADAAASSAPRLNRAQVIAQQFAQLLSAPGLSGLQNGSLRDQQDLLLVRRLVDLVA